MREIDEIDIVLDLRYGCCAGRRSFYTLPIEVGLISWRVVASCIVQNGEKRWDIFARNGNMRLFWSFCITKTFDKSADAISSGLYRCCATKALTSQQTCKYRNQVAIPQGPCARQKMPCMVFLILWLKETSNFKNHLITHYSTLEMQVVEQESFLPKNHKS